jgi:hypothetical protein
MRTTGCMIKGCPNKHYSKRLCKLHYERQRARHGNPLGRRPCGYYQTHLKLRQERGPATAQACAHCGGAADCWAYDHSKPDRHRRWYRGMPFSHDYSRYIALCWSCHRHFDRRHHDNRP